MSIKSFLSHMLLFSSGKKPKPSLGQASSAGKTHSQPKSEEDLLSSVVFLEGSEMKPIEECANSQGCWTAADEVSMAKRVNLVPNSTEGIVFTTPSKLERRELQAMSDRPSIAKFLHSIKRNTQNDHQSSNNQQTQAGSSSVCPYLEKTESIVGNTEESKNENEQSYEQKQEMIKEEAQIKLVRTAEADCDRNLTNHSIEDKCIQQHSSQDTNGQIEQEKKEVEEEKQENPNNRHDQEQQNPQIITADVEQMVNQQTKAFDEEGTLDESNLPAEPQPQAVDLSVESIQPLTDEIVHNIPLENADQCVENGNTTCMIPEMHCAAIAPPTDQCCKTESAQETPETHQKVTFEPALDEDSEKQENSEMHNSKLAGRKATPFSSLKHVPLPYLSRQNQFKNHNQQQAQQTLVNKNSNINCNSNNQISKIHHNNTNTSSNPANSRTTACRSLSDSKKNNTKIGIKTKLPLALTVKAFQEQKHNLNNNNLNKNLFQANNSHQQVIQTSISQDSRQICVQGNAIEIVEEKDSKGSHSDEQSARSTGGAAPTAEQGVDIQQLSGSSNDDSSSKDSVNKIRYNNKKLIGDDPMESQQQRRIKTTQGDALPTTVIRGTFLQNQTGAKIAYKTCIFCKNDIKAHEDTKTFTCCHKAHLGCVPKDKNIQCLRCNSNNMANKYRPKV